MRVFRTRHRRLLHVPRYLCPGDRSPRRPRYRCRAALPK